MLDALQSNYCRGFAQQESVHSDAVSMRDKFNV